MRTPAIFLSLAAALACDTAPVGGLESPPPNGAPGGSVLTDITECRDLLLQCCQGTCDGCQEMSARCFEDHQGDPCDGASGDGIYTGDFQGQRFITSRGITCEEALANCLLNESTLGPVRCAWQDRQIH